MDLLNTSEVAEMTRKPKATLRWYRHQGIGPKSGRLGGRVVFRRSDVEAWVEEQLAPPHPAVRTARHEPAAAARPPDLGQDHRAGSRAARRSRASRRRGFWRRQRRGQEDRHPG
jgi:predicted DNA-binding transcriptional regulator AlpA